MSSSGDGKLAAHTVIGKDDILAGDIPFKKTICRAQTLSRGTSAWVWVKGITGSAAIKGVWAVVRYPGFKPGSASNPLLNLPSFELRLKGSGQYEGSFNGFTKKGAYEVFVYAMDANGFVSTPKSTRVTQRKGR